LSVSYVAALQNTRMDAVAAAIDAHATLPGTLEIGTTGMAITLVAITLADPGFVRSGTPPNVLITMQGVPKSGTASATNTAAAARIKDGSGTVVVSGLTVGTSAADIILNSTSITNGQTVTITAGTITHSP
jgi:hypothetical protein